MKTACTTIIATFSICLVSVNAATIVPIAWEQSNSFNSFRLASNLSNATGMDAGQTLLTNHDGSPSGEPNNANDSQWMTSSKANPNTQAGRDAAMAAGKIWIIADLGASYDLTSVRIWNFSWDNTAGTPLTSLNNRGVAQFDLLLRNTEADTDDGSPSGAPINPAGVSDATNALTLAPVFNLGTLNPWTITLNNQALAVAPNNDTYTGESFSLTGNTARFVAIRVDSSYLDAGGIGLGKVRFEGTLAVPEPASALLGSLGLLTLLRRRR